MPDDLHCVSRRCVSFLRHAHRWGRWIQRPGGPAGQQREGVEGAPGRESSSAGDCPQKDPGGVLHPQVASSSLQPGQWRTAASDDFIFNLSNRLHHHSSIRLYICLVWWYIWICSLNIWTLKAKLQQNMFPHHPVRLWAHTDTFICTGLEICAAPLQNNGELWIINSHCDAVSGSTRCCWNFLLCWSEGKDFYTNLHSINKNRSQYVTKRTV